MNNSVAVILAGGKSNRFWPLTSKNLIPFSRGNLLEHHLSILSKLGIKDFIIVCSPEIAAFLRVNSDKFSDIRIERVMQNGENHGIGNAVLLGFPIYSKHFEGRPVYIVNCNDVYEDAIHEKIFKRFNPDSVSGVVGGFKVKTHKPLGYFKVEKDMVKGIVEKPTEEDRPSDFANMSLHLYKSYDLIANSIVSEKKDTDSNDDLYERALNMLCQTHKMAFVEYDGQWQVLKYPWETISVMNFFLKRIENNISDKVTIDKTAKITGPVIIEEGVKVLEFVRIVGPAVIKKNSIIGTGSMIRESIIGEGVIAGYHTEITRSYIGNNCWFHTNYIGDSVLGNGVTMGSGSVLANLRLDQKSVHSYVSGKKVDSFVNKFGSIIGNNTSIGVNASVMPGVKIGKNSVVGPMTVLKKDLEDNSKIIVEQKQQIESSRTVTQEPSRKNFRKMLKV